MSSDGLVLALIATTAVTLLVSLWLHLRALAALRKHRDWAQDVVHDMLHTQVDLGRAVDNHDSSLDDVAGYIDDLNAGRKVRW